MAPPNDKMTDLARMYEPVGWFWYTADGKAHFNEGDLNPKEVHDNGRPTHRAYRARQDQSPAVQETRTLGPIEGPRGPQEADPIERRSVGLGPVPAGGQTSQEQDMADRMEETTRRIQGVVMFKTTKPASKHWSAILPVNTCGYAKDWAKKQKSAASAWATCERGDWMLWLLGKWCDSDVQHRRIVLAACDCARLSLKYVEPGEERPLRAIETAERWARGGDDAPSLAEVRSASIAAAASYAYAAYACSAYACSAHTFDAEFSAYACYAYATNAAYARTAVLKQCADIVRKHFPIAPAHGTLLALQEIANG